jgi:hypothetical protein
MWSTAVPGVLLLTTGSVGGAVMVTSPPVRSAVGVPVGQTPAAYGDGGARTAAGGRAMSTAHEVGEHGRRADVGVLGGRQPRQRLVVGRVAQVLECGGSCGLLEFGSVAPDELV